MNRMTSLQFEFRLYAMLIWHWLWLIVLITALMAGTAYVAAVRTVPVYEASTLVLVNQAPSSNTFDYSTMMGSQLLAQTFAQVLTTRPVLDEVAKQLNLGPSGGALLTGKISVTLIQNTQLMRINVKDSNPNRAAAIANTIVTVFSQQNQTEQSARYASSEQNLQAQLDDLNKQIQDTSNAITNLAPTQENQIQKDQLNLMLVQYRQTYAGLIQSYEQVRLAEVQSMNYIVQKEPALPPTSPIAPQVFASAVEGGGIGLLLAAALIVLIEALDDTIRDPDEVTRRFGLPILGIIATHSNVEEPIAATQPRSPSAEAFRSLRTNIQYSSVDHPLHTLLITSPSPDDGKSTIAVNLAVTMAHNEKKVAIIDADLRRPTQHKIMKIKNREGLSSLFTQPELSVDGNLQSTVITNVSLLTSGSIPPNPAELLGSEKMMQILEQVRQKVDVIIIDSPPLLAVTDASILASRADGVLLVIKPQVSKLHSVKQACEQLKRAGANVLGVVMNDVPIRRSGYKYAYYKGYYYSYYQYYYTDRSSKSSGDQKRKKTT